MNGEQSGRWGRPAQPAALPALALVIERVLDEDLRVPVCAEFRFDPGMPLIVSATFTHGWSSVTWNIGRELLHRGLSEDAGDCDVQLWPTQYDEEKAWLILASERRSAVLELPVPPLADWIRATYRLVPAEAEADALDWDGFLADLLADGELQRPTEGNPS